jgi:hypothetical protein
MLTPSFTPNPPTAQQLELDVHETADRPFCA